jgi:hypothetical protein
MDGRPGDAELVRAAVAGDRAAFAAIYDRYADCLHDFCYSLLHDRKDSTPVPMTERSGSWFARLGPVSEAGTIPWRIVATDTRGNTASADGAPVTAVPCIG